jgi:hypothetical protein
MKAKRKTKVGTSARRRPPSAARKSAVAVPAVSQVGKRVSFDRETWQAVDLLARDSMKSFQELVDEAFRDLLAKHGRPDTLRAALRASAPPLRRQRRP